MINVERGEEEEEFEGAEARQSSGDSSTPLEQSRWSSHIWSSEIHSPVLRTVVVGMEMFNGRQRKRRASREH